MASESVMQEPNFDQVLETILARDPRYPREAYLFLREALDFTQKNISKENKDTVRHVTGQELLEGIREYALAQFGPMTLTVFEEWGVRRGEDFGEIVFNLVENRLLSKTDQDSRDDFKGVYDFTQAFRQPFLPKNRLSASNSEKRVIRPTQT
jgi:uncharacterized repeat protein (TIGR04138 family)